MIKIFIDSAAYMPSYGQIELGISVLPLSIVIEGREIYETEITNDNLYSFIRKNKVIPEIIPLSPSTITEAFEKEIIAGNTIIGVFLSAKLSDTYRNAVIARNKLHEKYPKANITVIDSEASCMREGLAAVAAYEKIQQGAWLEDVISAAENSKYYTRFMFVPDSMKYLEIGGKLNKAMAMLAGTFQIMPILEGKNGEVSLREKVLRKNKAIDKMVSILKKDAEKYGIRNVCVQHIDAIDKAMELAAKAEVATNVKVTISDIGPVIGANFGPGMMALLYRTKERMPDS